MDITGNLVGMNIRRLRKARRLTIEQLAKACLLAPKSISLIETGKVQPRRSNLEQIAKVLECTVNDFYKSGTRSNLFSAVKEATKEALSEREFRGFQLEDGQQVSIDELYESLRGMKSDRRDRLLKVIVEKLRSNQHSSANRDAKSVTAKPRLKQNR